MNFTQAFLTTASTDTIFPHVFDNQKHLLSEGVIPGKFSISLASRFTQTPSGEIYTVEQICISTSVIWIWTVNESSCSY